MLGGEVAPFVGKTCLKQKRNMSSTEIHSLSRIVEVENHHLQGIVEHGHPSRNPGSHAMHATIGWVHAFREPMNPSCPPSGVPTLWDTPIDLQKRLDVIGGSLKGGRVQNSLVDGVAQLESLGLHEVNRPRSFVGGLAQVDARDPGPVKGLGDVWGCGGAPQSSQSSDLFNPQIFPYLFNLAHN